VGKINWRWLQYNVKFSLKEDWDDENASSDIVDEQPIQEPTPQPEAINLNNLKLGDAIVVTQNLLDALMQAKSSVEQMAETITNASEPITTDNEQEIFPEEQEVEQEQEFKVDESLKEGKYSVFSNDKSKKDGSDIKSMVDTYDDLETAKKAAIEVSKDYNVPISVEDENGKQVFITEGCLGESLKLNEKLDLEGLKKLLQDYKDGKFELDSIYIDKDGWVATSDSSYSVEENLKQPKQKVNEALQVLGSLEDYSPSPSAKPLYDLIVSEGMLDELDKVLREIYQDGASIEELNNLLSTEKDFVKSMLGLDDVETSDELEKDIEDETIEEIEKEDSLPASEKEPEPKDKYLNDETGYGDDEDEDLSSLEAIVDSDEAKDM